MTFTSTSGSTNVRYSRSAPDRARIPFVPLTSVPPVVTRRLSNDHSLTASKVGPGTLTYETCSMELPRSRYTGASVSQLSGWFVLDSGWA